MKELGIICLILKELSAVSVSFLYVTRRVTEKTIMGLCTSPWDRKGLSSPESSPAFGVLFEDPLLQLLKVMLSALYSIVIKYIPVPRNLNSLHPPLSPAAGQPLF